MKTISIVNLKGGVGKTVTAVNMAAILAEEYNKNVLVVDADPQANATHFFGLDGDVNSIADLLNGDGGDVYEFIYNTKIPGVNLLPSDIRLIEADIASVRTGTGIDLLAGFLEALEAENQLARDFGDEIGFDYCIIDCPPSFTAASVAAISASDEVIIPVKIDAFSLGGMKELLAQLDSVRQIRPGVHVGGVLITMWHRCPAVVQGEELLRKSGVKVYENVIRRSDKVDESTFAGAPLICYSKQSAAGRDYMDFVGEFLDSEVQ